MMLNYFRKCSVTTSAYTSINILKRYYCNTNRIIKPLEGFKVLDLSRVLAGPWSTQILADLGAEVIKVESIQGDDTRQWGPPFYKDPKGNIGTAYFGCTNRNKKSIAVDFSQKSGQNLIQQLSKECDVLIENFKVGGLQKYNLDYKSISEINPKIVYCSITGFGQSGPCASLPGYDFAIQAMGGLMSITGTENEPLKCGVAIVDIMTGLYANVAIQSALHLRNRTGRGQHIDVSLLDVQATFLANQAQNYLLTGVNPKRIGNSHPSISPYDSLISSDGFYVVAIGNDSQFHSLCKTLGVSNTVISDERFINNSKRVANRKILLEILNERSKTKTTSEWIESLGKANVPCSPINQFSEVYSHPQIKHRNMIWELDLSNQPDNNTDNQMQNPSKTYDIEKLKVVGCPIHFSESNLQSSENINTPPPTLGQHTNDILKSIGISELEIERLRKSNTIK